MRKIDCLDKLGKLERNNDYRLAHMMPCTKGEFLSRVAGFLAFPIVVSGTMYLDIELENVGSKLVYGINGKGFDDRTRSERTCSLRLNNRYGDNNGAKAFKIALKNV